MDGAINWNFSIKEVFQLCLMAYVVIYLVIVIGAVKNDSR
jgi:hypothetical protein